MNRFIRTTIAVLLAVLFLGALALGMMPPALAAPATTIRYVAPGGNCGGATPCYATIQAAVDAASDGDEIKVAQGTYTDIHARAGITQVVYISKSVTIQGGYAANNWSVADPGAHATILDAGGKGRVLYVTSYNDITIQDLRVTGGDAAGLGGDPWGNDAGGGVFVNMTPVHLRHIVVANSKAYRGGGLFLNSSDSVIQDCEIISNTADSGAGLYLVGGHDRLQRNVIRTNRSDWGGGGLLLNGSDSTLTNNVIIDNQAGTYEGGGIFFYAGAPQLLYTTIANNSKSGVFVDNGGGNFSTMVTMTNTIISGHAVGVKISSRQNNTVALAATLWHGNATNREIGGGVINHTKDFSGDPAFAADGYHLTASSAAINKGIDAGVHNDIDGEIRPWGGGYDIGVDEFGSIKAHRLYLPVILNK